MTTKNKNESTALVVGGSSGMGLAGAQALLTRGTDVHIVGRTKSKLDKVKQGHPDIEVHQADATNREELEQVLDKIEKLDWLIVTMSGQEGGGPLQASGVQRGEMDGTQL